MFFLKKHIFLLISLYPISSFHWISRISRKSLSQGSFTKLWIQNSPRFNPKSQPVETKIKTTSISNNSSCTRDAICDLQFQLVNYVSCFMLHIKHLNCVVSSMIEAIHGNVLNNWIVSLIKTLVLLINSMYF